MSRAILLLILALIAVGFAAVRLSAVLAGQVADGGAGTDAGPPVWVGPCVLAGVAILAVLFRRLWVDRGEPGAYKRGEDDPEVHAPAPLACVGSGTSGEADEGQTPAFSRR